jgi:Kef-type K+ transport system membrane component KefB
MGIEIYYKFILSFAIILIAARIGGEISTRFLKQPAVIGEVLVGILISPYALGGLLNDPILLNFGTIEGAFGLSEFSPMEIIAEISIIVLLFIAGIETDIRSFAKYTAVGSAVALGGILLPFILSFIVTMLLASEEGLIGWLFMGATFTAPSIGVTVRLLMNAGRLNTKGGTIILVAAVLDDILGIVVLSMMLTLVRTGSVNPVNIVSTLFIGLAVWAVFLLIGLYLNRYISKYLLAPFRKSGTVAIVAIIVGFVIAYLVTLVNLHPVVGAYIAGLMFSATVEKEEISESMKPIGLFLAPFFFTYLGMQIHVFMVWSSALLGFALLIAATAGKIIGCYLPTKFVAKLSHKGSAIVGIAMVPRGEVALIIAGTGLLTGAISRELFGVAAIVGILTIFITPLMLRLVVRGKLFFKSDKKAAST